LGGLRLVLGMLFGMGGWAALAAGRFFCVGVVRSLCWVFSVLAALLVAGGCRL